MFLVLGSLGVKKRKKKRELGKEEVGRKEKKIEEEKKKQIMTEGMIKKGIKGDKKKEKEIKRKKKEKRKKLVWRKSVLEMNKYIVLAHGSLEKEITGD